MLGEAAIDMKDILSDCSLIKKPLCLNKSYFENVMKKNNPNLKMKFDSSNDNHFWLPLNQKNKEGKIEKNGLVKVQVDVLPFDQATKNPVGKARDNPNHSPTLPQPEGRVELSMNPIKMLNQMIGPEVRRKIYIGLCIAVCVALCLAILPNILGTLVAKMLVG
mmetsp:Transcript_30295/g.46326  ORF Transcript_30295/g.46326 Transcript_30295/m.46326 type:complete len:163 (+) Transcript_30295:4312-4800(+)